MCKTCSNSSQWPQLYFLLCTLSININISIHSHYPFRQAIFWYEFHHKFWTRIAFTNDQRIYENMWQSKGHISMVFFMEYHSLSADIINLNESGKHPIQIRLLELATVFTNCVRSHISDLCHFHSYNCIWQWGVEQQMLTPYCWLPSLGSIHCRHVWSWTCVRTSWKSTAVTHTSSTNFFHWLWVHAFGRKK